MQPHEQAQFLTALGEFVIERINLVAAPLLEKIERLEDHIDRLERHTAEAINVLPSEKHIQAMILGALADFDDAVSTCGNNAHEAIQKAVEEIKALIPEAINGKDGEPGKDGTSVSLDDINILICDSVEKQLSTWPIPKNGEPGKDGESISIETVSELVRNCIPTPQDIVKELDAQGIVDKVVSLIPAPKDGEDGEPGKDGKSIEIVDLVPVVTDLVVKTVTAIPIPASVVGGLIDRFGNLCLTFSDGTIKDLGHVVGKDGEPGAPGKDGADGLGFKDMTAVWDGERTLTLKFQLEDRVEELTIKLPYQFYKGTWKDGAYDQGDSVSRSGSTWIAIRDTDKMPGTVDSGWVLSCKKGGDGRDAVSKKGDPGPPGRDGKDLTQIGPDGSKW